MRHNFKDYTKTDLARNAHLHCVFPGCPQATHGPTVAGDKSINIGIAAHSAAASEGGPRFDSTMTPEQIRAYENGAWLCATHATLVDRDPDAYSVEMMRQWQASAEQRSSRALTGRHLGANVDIVTVCQRLDAFIAATRGIYIDMRLGIEPFVEVKRNVEGVMHQIVRECSGASWRPTNGLYSLHPVTVAIQARAIRALDAICREIDDSNKWVNDNYSKRIRGVESSSFLRSPQDESRIALSVRTIRENSNEYWECMGLIQEYASGNRLW